MSKFINTITKKELKTRLRIAKELGYPEEVIAMLKSCRTVEEASRILHSARLGEKVQRPARDSSGLNYYTRQTA